MLMDDRSFVHSSCLKEQLFKNSSATFLLQLKVLSLKKIIFFSKLVVPYYSFRIIVVIFNLRVFRCDTAEYLNFDAPIEISTATSRVNEVEGNLNFVNCICVCT